MKEFTEKLISRLEEESYDMEICEEQFDMNRPYFKDVPYKMLKLEDVKTIISQFAEEYVPDTNVGKKDGKTLTEQECFDEEGEEMLLIEDVLDTLIEVGNGVTDEALHECADKLFRVRDILNSKANDDGWIPVEERLPEERDSIFKKWKGTDKWSDAMFEKTSDEVIVTVEYENGERRTKTSHTIDGEWNTGQSILPFKVIAWQPLPAPYKEKGE